MKNFKKESSKMIVPSTQNFIDDVDFLSTKTFVDDVDFKTPIDSAMAYAVMNGSKVDVKQTYSKNANSQHNISVGNGQISFEHKKEKNTFIEQVFHMHD